jgi:hypothetical protein
MDSCICGDDVYMVVMMNLCGGDDESVWCR